MSFIDHIRSEAAKKASDISPAWGKAGMIAAGIITAGTVVRAGLDIHEESKMKKQMRIQKKNREQRQEEYDNFDKNVYYNLEMLNGLPQQLHNRRIGHTNTWGGTRY